jgi:hypothetical protein
MKARPSWLGIGLQRWQCWGVSMTAAKVLIVQWVWLSLCRLHRAEFCGLECAYDSWCAMGVPTVTRDPHTITDDSVNPSCAISHMSCMWRAHTGWQHQCSPGSWPSFVAMSIMMVL